jgi:hypothetical protein
VSPALGTHGNWLRDYDALGRLLLVLSVTLTAVGFVLEFFPTEQVCTASGLSGNCVQTAYFHPYSTEGTVILFSCLVLASAGLVLYFRNRTEPLSGRAEGAADWPFARRLHRGPFPPASLPSSSPPTGEAEPHEPPSRTPRLLFRCKNCGNTFDLMLGDCDVCGAEAS